MFELFHKVQVSSDSLLEFVRELEMFRKFGAGLEALSRVAQFSKVHKY